MKILVEEFDLYKNGNKRKLFMCKGPNFTGTKNSVVMLAHDAHNMFSEHHYSVSGQSWETNEAFESIGVSDYLVFGLECLNGIERIREYSPVENRVDLVEEYANGQVVPPYGGIEYLEALFKDLIPYVSQKFQFDFNNTKKIMIGSSMGGVITTYAAFEYPEKFDAFLSFSNAFYANEPYIFDYADTKQKIGKYYHDMGGNEVSGAIADKEKYIYGYKRMEEILKKLNADYMSVFDEKGIHSEVEWSKRLPKALAWSCK